MRIASIEARAVDCGFQTQALQTSRVASPMSRWPQFGARRASWMWPSKKVFVRVESADGAVGWGCTNGGEVVALIVEQHLSRLLQGADATSLEDIWDQMFFSLLPSDRSGFSMMAIAAVDIALWDLMARSAGCPLVELLGGARTRTLTAYATTPQPDAHRGKTWWGLKAAMPFGPESGDDGLRDNVAMMRSFAKAAEGGHIMLDAFMAWDADYTLRFVDAARDLDIHWIEDPLPPYDLEGLHRLKQEAGDGVRLALGNFAFNRWDCETLLREGLVDILQPDVAWAGGITETLRILAMADAADVPVILHNTCEQPWALALAAARQADPIVEFVERGAESPLYTLMGERPRVEKGRVAVPSAGNQPPPPVEARFRDPAERALNQSTRR